MSHHKPQGKTAVMAAIKEATAILIAERGTRSVTLRDIARKANVNHGLIVRHFGTKEKLIESVGLGLVSSIIEETGAGNRTLLETLAHHRPAFTEWVAAQKAELKHARSFRLSHAQQTFQVRPARVKDAPVPPLPPRLNAAAKLLTARNARTSPTAPARISSTSRAVWG